MKKPGIFSLMMLAFCLLLLSGLPVHAQGGTPVRSQLTNEWIDGTLANSRPIAVMVPNDSSALPHYNVANAGVYYQCMVEGNITRTMAVIENWENMERIGNVRSVRDYYVYWAYEWDSILCHFGGPKIYVNDILAQPYTQHIDGLSAPGGVFYRTKDRKAPQNAYLSGSGILKAMNTYGYSKAHTQLYLPNHFVFAPDNAPNTLLGIPGAANASTVDLTQAYPVDKTIFTYNAADGLYYRSEFGKAHTDAATGTQLAFKNIILQNTYWENRDANTYKYFQVLDNTRDGYYITNGKAIHVRWKKESAFAPTKYYDDNGNEVQFNTGKTMICVIQAGKPISIA